VTALVLAACAGPGVLAGGEGVQPPAPPAPLFSVEVVAADDSTPLVASIAAPGATAVATDGAGAAAVGWDEAWELAPATLTVTAPGFHNGAISVGAMPDEVVQVRLDPVVLDGRVVTPDGVGLPGTIVTLAGQETTTDQDGSFRIVRAEPGTILLTRPAWSDTEVVWESSSLLIELEMVPLMIRALRVSGDKAGDDVVWQQLLDLADTTAVNALVIDTKDESGTVMRDVDVQTAYDVGAVVPYYDTDRLIADMDAHGIYKITRIVTFQDDPLATSRPDLATRNVVDGSPWENNRGLAWLDPTDRAAWEYPLELAVESCRRGFDEIQFDYVRFPSDGDVDELEFDGLTWTDYYAEETEQQRLVTVAAFLEEAQNRLNPLGCAVAADIFAITLESPSDEGIGQSPESLADAVDVLSPMIYTYTYAPGWKGFENPDDHAVEIVTGALDAGIPRLDGFSIYRPWLQRAFITDAEILEIQRIAEDRGLGWMLWSANTEFNSTMLPPG
jgi:hypothetical protein